MIRDLRIFPTTMRLRTPIPMASGVIESTDNVVIELVTDTGLVGWGEGVEAPALTAQHQADIVADIEALQGLVIGADPMRRNRLWFEMMNALPRRPPPSLRSTSPCTIWRARPWGFRFISCWAD